MVIQQKIKNILPASIAKFVFGDRGMQALVVTNLFGNILRLLSNLILARLLSPEAFAIAGLAATVIFAFNMISDGGFRAFILRHTQGDEDSVLNTLWTVKLVRDFLLALLMFIFADSIAAFFDLPELSLVLQVLCLAFVIDAFVPIGMIAIERQNRVATVMYIRFLCALLSTLFMVVGVYIFNNYWPMIISMVLNHFFQVVFGYVFVGAKGTALAINRDIFKEFLGWIKYIIPSSVITLLLVQFDKVILGKTLSPVELGLYFVAFNFSSAAANFAIEYARGILQPYLSIVYRESPDQYLEKYYAKKLRVSMFLAFSIGLLSGGSYLFFDVLYDDRYLKAGYYLSILLVTPIMSLVTYSSEVSLILMGNIKATVVANVIRLIWFVGGAWFAYQWYGVAGLLFVIALTELFPALYMAFKLKRLQCIHISKELLIIISAVIGFFLSRFLAGYL